LYFRAKRAILPRSRDLTVKKTATVPSRSPRRRRRVIEYLLGFVGVVVLVEALVGDNGFLAMLKARQEYQALEQSLAHARADNDSLREEARRLREDPAAIEDLARRELGLIKPGEKLFIVKDVPGADSARRDQNPNPK
jgi:cell division protein FtsB